MAAFLELATEVCLLNFGVTRSSFTRPEDFCKFIDVMLVDQLPLLDDRRASIATRSSKRTTRLTAKRSKPRFDFGMCIVICFPRKVYMTCLYGIFTCSKNAEDFY